MTKHTETPWIYNTYDKCLDGKDGHCIAQMNRQFDAEANARFIVKAVNSHDKLVEALNWIYNFANDNTGIQSTEQQIIRAKCWLVLSQLDKEN